MDSDKPSLRKVLGGKWQVKDLPKVVFLYTLRYIIPRLSLKVQHRFSDVLAILTARGEKYAVISNELQELLGSGTLTEGEIKQIVRQTLANFRKELFETWSFLHINKAQIEDMCYIEGLEHLDSSLKKGNGVIIMLCHFGLYKMLLPALAYKGYRITQVAANPTDFISPTESVIRNITMNIEYECE
ncbi:MAG: hypothetical protein L3V56_11110, partial [Candidatus Magnetoovum sp. WYHC-5]|nr:hypothetical protein [Candidatus Magnetoovum sp. WYHC-5]